MRRQSCTEVDQINVMHLTLLLATGAVAAVPRCQVNAKDDGEPKTKGLNPYTCAAAKSDIDCFDLDSCEYNNNKLKDRLQSNA